MAEQHGPSLKPHLLGAWALHQRVPPERWAITTHELWQFVDDVRQLWAGGRIPNSLDFPNQIHDDPSHGPNLHQVNDHVVKPQTLKAGGMSYALMKHPQGLECQVFVSHCWDGGIFHLERSIRSAWPPLSTFRNLYCCLLANPQNLDINAFIGGNLLNSAFARALAKASHLLVVPNPTVAVYSRLWCVFEAYLGVEWEKIYLLPIKPIRTAVAAFWWRSCGRLMLGGMVVGSPAFWYFSKSAPSSHMFILHIASRSFRSISLCWQVFSLPCWRAKHATCIASGVSFIDGAMLMLGLAWSCYNGTDNLYFELLLTFIHYGWSVNMALMNCLISVLQAFKIFEAKEFERQEKMMHFDSLRMAHCSHQKDEERIRAEIQGREDEVETVINILIRSGAYTDRLRRLWDSGFSVKRKGSTDFTIATVWAILVWVWTALDCVCSALIHPSSLTSAFALALAGGCLLMVVLILISVPWFQSQGPDQAVLALQAWQITGMISLQLPCIVKLLVLGGEDLTCTSLGHCHADDGWISISNSIAWFVLPVRAVGIVGATAALFFQGIYYLRPKRGTSSQMHLLDYSSESDESRSSSEDGSDCGAVGH